MRLILWVGFWTFLLDQVTKYYVLYVIKLPSLPEQVFDVFPPFVTLRMAWNRGVNFGLFAGLDMRWWLVGLSVVIVLAVLWWARRERFGRWANISAGLMIGGALGNVIDRVLHGAVADFLNMSCCGINNPYAFNVADITIFMGALGLVLFTDSKSRKNTA